MLFEVGRSDVVQDIVIDPGVRIEVVVADHDGTLERASAKGIGGKLMRVGFQTAAGFSSLPKVTKYPGAWVFEDIVPERSMHDLRIGSEWLELVDGRDGTKAPAQGLAVSLKAKTSGGRRPAGWRWIGSRRP